MPKVENGDIVKIHYAGKLSDGTVFDSSKEGEPLEFTVGQGRVIDGLNDGVMGMAIGESKTIKISPDRAFGEQKDELVAEVEKDQLPATLEPQVGQKLESMQDDGRLIIFTVAEVKEQSIVLDANHPLAGKDLAFEVELVEIAERQESEIQVAAEDQIDYYNAPEAQVTPAETSPEVDYYALLEAQSPAGAPPPDADDVEDPDQPETA